MIRAVVFLGLAACGGAPTIASHLVLNEGLSASDIASYRVSVVSPTDKKGAHLTHADGSPLTCADFLDDTLPSATLTLYIDATFTLDPSDATTRSHDLSVPPGTGYWLLGEGFDSSAADAITVARACTSSVTVSSHATTDVPLDFFACTAGPVDNPGLTCQ